jgi:hypothetical protein
MKTHTSLASTPSKIRGYVTSKLSNFIKINPKPLHLSNPPEISYPLYLPNVEQLGKNKNVGCEKNQKGCMTMCFFALKVDTF